MLDSFHYFHHDLSLMSFSRSQPMLLVCLRLPSVKCLPDLGKKSSCPDLAGNSSTAALNTAMPRVPRGRRLFPARSTAVMASISEAASSAGDAPPLLPVGERPSAEVEHGDDAM